MKTTRHSLTIGRALLKGRPLIAISSYVLLSIGLLLPAARADNTYQAVASLKSSPTLPGSPQFGDAYGQGVLLHGNYLFVAAPVARPLGLTIAGAIYVYRRSGEGSPWQNTQIITTNGLSDHIGGFKMEARDETLFFSAVGTPVGPIPNDTLGNQNFTGSVQIYHLGKNGQWTFGQSIDSSIPGLQDLTPVSGAAALNPFIPAFLNQQGASLGLFFSVDTKSEVMLVGAEYQAGVDAAHHALVNAGAVYAFKNNKATGRWQLVQKLTNPDGMSANDTFGANVVLNGDMALISNGVLVQTPRIINPSPNSSVYVYRQDKKTGTWAFQQKLIGDQQGPSFVFSPAFGGTIPVGDGFGSALALNEDYAVIGAALESKGAGTPLSGAAYFYDVTESHGQKTLTFRQKFFSDDPTAQGTSFVNVLLDDNVALISDPTRSGPAGQAQGGLLVFKNAHGAWTRTQTLYDPQGIGFGFFGFSASKQGNQIAVGSSTFTPNIFFQTIGNPLLAPPPPFFFPGSVVIFSKHD